MKLIIVSNRLPVAVNIENGKVEARRSFGGVALGLATYLEKLKSDKRFKKSLWVGWPGSAVPEKLAGQAGKKLAQENLLPVFLSEQEIENFYHGFSNDTLWPLFHSFPASVNYNQEQWQAYRHVNQLFAEVVAEQYETGDVIWIHDYQLMLLPKRLRERLGPAAEIGFFLHIPFPPFEVFRLLPDRWRKSLLNGILGADLIGFHTYDYTEYFANSVQRILGHENNLQQISTEKSVSKIETFPMGIDFEKFHNSSLVPAVQQEIKNLRKTTHGLKVILSIDRLDYTKGLVKRLRAFEQFLSDNPKWLEKVLLIMVVVPSRTEVAAYQEMKRQIDELIGAINGRFGTVKWSPIIYQFKSLGFNELTALYNVSDVALVTPLRDGMNLVAKEYVASRRNPSGVLILSEMAGASAELGEALIINPNHEEAIVSALENALTMTQDKQKQALLLMQDRLKRYDIQRWAEDFVSSLMNFKSQQADTHKTLHLNPVLRGQVAKKFKTAKKRILFLDYDGTLVHYASYPMLARPTPELLNILQLLGNFPATSVVLISGRDKLTLDSWFKKVPVWLVSEHGAYVRQGRSWKRTQSLKNDWKEIILPVMATYADRLPGAFVEEKDYALVFHYRLSNPRQAQARVNDLTSQLLNMTSNLDVQVAQGKKIVEVKSSGADKGAAVLRFLEQDNYDFILAVGDDFTDEDMFKAVPGEAHTIKVGHDQTAAKYYIDNADDTLNLLEQLIEEEKR